MIVVVLLYARLETPALTHWMTACCLKAM